MSLSLCNIHLDESHAVDHMCACSRRRGGGDTPDYGDAVDLAAMSLFECLPLQIHDGEDFTPKARHSWN